MTTLKKLLGATVMAACAAAMNAAHADSKSDARANVACNVAINYSQNGVLAQSYSRDFVVTLGTAFAEDLSTATRQREFNATLAPEGGNLVLTIGYFSDVGVFDATSFAAQLKLSNGRNFETTSGNMTHFHVQGTSTSHSTDYILTCRRR